MAGVIYRILDSARWAPSGDNTQPWRFEVRNEDHVVVHGHDTRATCVYDLDGRPSQISLGALLETLRIAATGFGLRAQWTRRQAMPDDRPTFDVYLKPDPDVRPSPLIRAIPERSVHRRALSGRPLSSAEKTSLESVLDPGYRIRWFEGTAAKWRMAKLMFHNAKLRLTMHEAYCVHREIIHWHRRYSEDRVPDQALGADPMTVVMMRWAMQDWKRVEFLNRWLAGTWLPRLQMDLLPGLRCAAHLALLADRAPATIDDYVRCGTQVQRFWLATAGLGIQHQPEVTPLVFARYVREGIAFTASGRVRALADRLAVRASRVLSADLSNAFWIGRVGDGPPAHSRSVRLPLCQLLVGGDASPQV